jgi:hypothetical protein
MGNATAGARTKFAVQDGAVSAIGDFGSGSFQYEFISESLKKISNLNYNSGIRGTRARSGYRVVKTSETVTGQVAMQPTPVELDTWLPRILGGAKSSTSFPMAETLPVFGCLFDRGVQRHIYTNCSVDRAVFACSQNQPMSLTAFIEGSTEVLSNTAFPVGVPAIDAGQPYTMAETTISLSVAGTATVLRQFSIDFNNLLEKDRYMNSITRAQIPPEDRDISFSIIVPYTSDEASLYNQSVAGGSGTLTLTNGSASLVFAFDNLKTPDDTPTATGKNELFLPLSFKAYFNDSAEVAVTNSHS